MTSKLRLLVVLLAIAIDPSSVNAQITSNELAGLVPRNIGPATMIRTGGFLMGLILGPTLAFRQGPAS